MRLGKRTVQPLPRRKAAGSPGPKARPAEREAALARQMVRIRREMRAMPTGAFDLDLGDNHWLTFVGWQPDRKLNPQYDGIPDEPRAGAEVTHLKPDGTLCAGFVHFDTPVVRKVFHPESIWRVVSWQPLTLEPSILCKACGDHGHITESKWVRA